jgi:hypothetical protein
VPVQWQEEPADSVLAQKAEMPLPSAFNVGDRWQWQQVDNRTKAVEGIGTRTVVDDGGIIKFSFSDLGTRPISSAFLGNPSKKPWRIWPLQVGDKWSYDEDWTRPDGATGNSSQDAEVIAFGEVTPSDDGRTNRGNQLSSVAVSLGTSVKPSCAGAAAMRWSRSPPATALR